MVRKLHNQEYSRLRLVYCTIVITSSNKRELSEIILVTIPLLEAILSSTGAAWLAWFRVLSIFLTRHLGLCSSRSVAGRLLHLRLRI